MLISHSQPYFDENDVKALADVLTSKYVSFGEKAKELGRCGAETLGKQWGIATQSGTDALTAALYLSGLKEGDKVIVPAYICSAPLDALAYLNLIPEPIDINRETLAVLPELINKKTEVSTVIAAHLFGIPADLHSITGKNIIEDCAQTLSIETIGGHKIGSIGTYSICSFYATKLLTTGHGGLIAGNDPESYQLAMNLFNHDKQDKWSPHLHFLMSDFNAAIGLSQIKKLDQLINARKEIAKRFTKVLTGESKLADSIYSRFLVISKNHTVEEVCQNFLNAGIEAKRPVYKPLYMYLNYDDEQFPNARWAHDHIISVPIYPGMEENHIQTIEAFLEKNKDDLRCWPPT